MSDEDIKNTRNMIESEFDRIFASIYNKDQNHFDEEFNLKKYEVASNFIDELEKQFDLSEESFNKIFGGEFNSDFTGKIVTNNTPKVPIYLLLDILRGLIEKGISNGRGNTLQKEKTALIKRVEALKSKALNVKYDKSFDSSDTITEDAISRIVTSGGNFSVSYKKLSEYDKNFTTLLEDRNLLVLETVQRSVGMNGLENDIMTYSTSNILLKNVKRSIENEYESKRKETLLNTINEIKDFFNGIYPQTFEEAKKLLISMGYDMKYNNIFDQFELRYKYLENENDFLPDERIFSDFVNNVKSLSSLKRNSKIRPNEGQRRVGLFGFARDLIKTIREGKEDHASFEEERTDQIQEDDEIINKVAEQYNIQHQTVDGKVVRHI